MPGTRVAGPCELSEVRARTQIYILGKSNKDTYPLSHLTCHAKFILKMLKCIIFLNFPAKGHSFRYILYGFGILYMVFRSHHSFLQLLTDVCLLPYLSSFCFVFIYPSSSLCMVYIFSDVWSSLLHSQHISGYTLKEI